MNGIIGLGDYPLSSPIHGMMAGADMNTLQKALQTGSSIVAAGATGGPTFRVQSLEGTLKVAMEKSASELVLWNKLAKQAAQSTVIEFTRQNSWGADQGLFSSEIADLVSQDAAYERVAAMIKFLTVKKEVSYAATLVNGIVDPMAQMAHEGTMQLLRAAERAFVFGNCNAAVAGLGVNAYEFDGLISQITAAAATSGNEDIILDWLGNAPSEDMLEQAGKIVSDKYGNLNYMVMANQAKADLTRSMFPNQRINMPIMNAEGRYGNPLNNYLGSFSEMEIKASRYMKRKAPLAATQTTGGVAGTDIAPSALTAATLTTPGNAASLMEAKAYYYWLSASANGKESAYYPAITSGKTATPAVGQSVVITVGNAEWGSGEIAGSYMNVYRSTVNNAATATLIGSVVNAAGTDTVFTDLNSIRDNCADAIGLTFEPDVISLRQLAPLTKMDLAQVTNSLPFMLLLFLTLVLFVPTKCVWIKNIGKLVTE